MSYREWKANLEDRLWAKALEQVRSDSAADKAAGGDGYTYEEMMAEARELFLGATKRMSGTEYEREYGLRDTPSRRSVPERER